MLSLKLHDDILFIGKKHEFKYLLINNLIYKIHIILL